MIALALALALTAVPQEAPAACEPAAGVRPDWAACAQALPEGSPQQRMARLNQATEAYLNRDYGTAERLYDRIGDFGPWATEVMHAFRADTLQQVGRDKEATADARVAWDLLATGPDTAPTAEEQPSLEERRRFVLTLVLPILKKARDPAFEAAFAAFRALPVKGAAAHSDLALVLEQLGDLEGALEASLVTVKAEPTNPGYLNNHCYILVRAGRPAEGLPFCEKAVQGAPDVAAVRHSLAAALAGTGRCAESEVALAEARRLDPATVLYQQPIACAAN
jgi:Flp pilus assembly protein TadD